MTSPYSTQLLADFERHDDLQLVTLYNTVTKASTANVKAINREISYKEALLGAPLGLESTDQMWLLGCKSLGSATPDRGHWITTADGAKWTIDSTKLRSFGDTGIFWECIARKQP
jgi:hypothetical protein